MTLTPVTINVPTELVLEFQDAAHELLVRLRRGERPFHSEPPRAQAMQFAQGFRPLDVSEAKGVDVWKLPRWGTDESDTERARWVVGDLRDNQVGIVASLATHAGERISGDVIADETNYGGPRSVAPAMRGLALRCRRVQRRPFWLFHPSRDSGQGTYEMPLDVAELFRPALDERRKDR